MSAVPIRVENVGPVTEFEYTMEDYGLHVLRGEQGAGKTTVLRTVTLATSGKLNTPPTKRDGTKRGIASIGGKTIKIARTVREEGELDVEGLGDLDISVLHWPKFKDASTRDKYRIQTLVRLSGVTADISLFYDLLGDESKFWSAVDRSASEKSDLVEMAGAIKRGIDTQALAEEKLAATARSRAAAEREQAASVDVTGEHNAATLQGTLEAAVLQQASVHARAANAEEQAAAVAEARARLDEIRQMHDGPSPDQALKRVHDATAAATAAAARVNELRTELAEAEEAHAAATVEVAAAEREHALVIEHLTEISTMEEIVSNADVSAPTDEELLAAADAVQDAKLAVENGVRIRQAIASAESADTFNAEADIHAAEARRLREAARGTFDCLSDAIGRIPNCALRIWNDENGAARLVTTTDRSNNEPFDELSDGERWKLILPLCVGPERVVVLSQAAFGELQPANRLLIHNLAKKHECFILTALADDGELRCEAYEGTHDRVPTAGSPA